MGQIPKGYKSSLSIMDTEIGIKIIKDTFERKLAELLKLTRVSAPLFVLSNSGLNDNLSGLERPVSFDILHTGDKVEIVHSLAKWKRLALKRYDFKSGDGLYADMNAIRRDETLDNTHSLYVDQWDWERIISIEERSLPFLRQIVEDILDALKLTIDKLHASYPVLTYTVPDELLFITSEELLGLYPDMTAKEREDAICKERGAVFISQIGKKLSNGEVHDLRAPDYDDWEMNGDLLVWNPVLGHALELSSMGIRVDEKALEKQLHLSGHKKSADLPFHAALLRGELPLTIGGGIGQSRLCMLLLEKAHIAEVQVSVWPAAMTKSLENAGVTIL